MDASLQEVSDDIGPDLPEPEAWLLIEHSCAGFAGGTHGQTRGGRGETESNLSHTYCVSSSNAMMLWIFMTFS